MEEQRKNDWWLPSGIIHWLWSRLREMCCPAHWPLAVKLMGPSRLYFSSFSISDCYLSSSIFRHLPAGVKFQIRSLAGPRTLGFYDSTRGTQLDSHSILGSLLSPHSPFLCKKKRRLMAFPEWVGGVCVEYVPLCELKTLLECTHKSKVYFLLSAWFFLAQNDRKFFLWTKSVLFSRNCSYEITTVVWI